MQGITDKESGMFFKDEKEKCFAYLSHTACDNNNFIIDFQITPGNVHDSVAFNDLYINLKSKVDIPISAIAMDAGYITPYICKTLIDDEIIPAIPYKRPMTKKASSRNTNMYMMNIMIAIFVQIIRY